MNELLVALTALLERGIVVEPTTNTPFGPVGHRIRLAEDDDKTGEEWESDDIERGRTHGW